MVPRRIDTQMGFTPARQQNLASPHVHVMVRRIVWSQPKLEPRVSVLEPEAAVKVNCVVTNKVGRQLHK